MDQGRFGEEAQRALAKLLPLRRMALLDLDIQETDVYGRLLAFVWTKSDVLANEEMLRLGYAVVDIRPPNVKYEDVLRKAAKAAQQARSGLWATSAFDCRPSDFRHHLCQ
jgi:micrococcal nuclease